MKKRSIAFFLVISLIVSMMSACGFSEAASAEESSCFQDGWNAFSQTVTSTDTNALSAKIDFRKKATDAKEYMSDAKGLIVEKTSEGKEKFLSTASEVKETVGEKTEELKKTIGEQAANVHTAFGDVIETEVLALIDNGRMTKDELINVFMDKEVSEDDIEYILGSLAAAIEYAGQKGALKTLKDTTGMTATVCVVLAYVALRVIQYGIQLHQGELEASDYTVYMVRDTAGILVKSGLDENVTGAVGKLIPSAEQAAEIGLELIAA